MHKYMPIYKHDIYKETEVAFMMQDINFLFKFLI